MRDAYAVVHEKYAVDLLDPRTWYRGVFGEGTRETDIGIGGDSGLSPSPKAERTGEKGSSQAHSQKRSLFEPYPGYHWV